MRPGLSLQHDDLHGPSSRPEGAVRPPRPVMLGIDPPFVQEMPFRCRRPVRWGTQILGNIEADAAGADDGDTLACRFRPRQQLDVAHAFAVRDARDLGNARPGTGGDHDFIEIARWQASPHLGSVEPQANAEFGDARAKIAQRLVEFLLARNRARQIELPTDALPRLQTA